MTHTREQKLRLIDRATHLDYRGTIEGKPAILVLRKGGTWLVQLDDLTEAEIAPRYMRALQLYQIREV